MEKLVDVYDRWEWRQLRLTANVVGQPAASKPRAKGRFGRASNWTVGKLEAISLFPVHASARPKFKPAPMTRRAGPCSSARGRAFWRE